VNTKRVGDVEAFPPKDSGCERSGFSRVSSQLLLPACAVVKVIEGARPTTGPTCSRKSPARY